MWSHPVVAKLSIIQIIWNKGDHFSEGLVFVMNGVNGAVAPSFA